MTTSDLVMALLAVAWTEAICLRPQAKFTLQLIYLALKRELVAR